MTFKPMEMGEMGWTQLTTFARWLHEDMQRMAAEPDVEGLKRLLEISDVLSAGLYRLCAKATGSENKEKP